MFHMLLLRHHEGAPRYAARRSRSLNTPPAVTSAPAPGPLHHTEQNHYVSLAETDLDLQPRHKAWAGPVFGRFWHQSTHEKRCRRRLSDMHPGMLTLQPSSG